MLETPANDYQLLLSLIDEASDRLHDAPLREQMLGLLHKLRPRGMHLTVCVRVNAYRDGVLKYLCVTRKSDPSKVCFAGGHVELADFVQMQGFMTQTESMLEVAALRELAEETGLRGLRARMVYADVDECGTYCVMHEVKPLDSDSTRLKPESGTECLWLTANEFMARCAWPDYYKRARDAGAL